MSRRQVKKWAGQSAAELRKRWGRESVYLFGGIDSTNEAAADLAEAGAPAGSIVLAREQSAGRGREGRRWHSPPGSGLYLTMLFRPAAAELGPLISILAGLGVVRRLDQAYPELSPALKWPNDLMAGDRKFGGILAEAVWGDAEPRHLVVGVGINVSSGDGFPKSMRRSAGSIEDLVEAAELLQVTDAVVAGLETYLLSPPPTLDAATLDLLDDYDWLKNRRMALEQNDEETVGVGVGIAPDGALLFRPDRGALRRVTAGHVVAEGR